MKRYCTSFLVVMLCYGVGLYSPAASAQAQRVDYDSIRKYVNGKQKKSVKDLYVKYEKSLPSGMYESAMKQMKGNSGNAWFDGVKMGQDSVYMRIGKVKLLAKAATEKNGERVVYLNGAKLTQNHFRDVRAAQNVIMNAYYKELLTKKGLFSSLFTPNAYAGVGEDQGELGTGAGKGGKNELVTGEPIPVLTDHCRNLMLSIQNGTTAQERNQCEQNLNQFRTQCCQTSNPFCESTNCGAFAAAASDEKNNNMLWILLGVGAAALLLFLLFKKDKKDDKPVEPPVPPTPGEIPEDEDGVGRPPILCQGQEANCGGNTTYPDPPTYVDVSETSGSSSSESYPVTGSNSNVNSNSGNSGGNAELGNSNSESSGGVGREKLRRARVKTK